MFLNDPDLIESVYRRHVVRSIEWHPITRVILELEELYQELGYRL